jgi:acyl-CoA ligase (AMP-forming) (exosortase A-associated)
MFIDLQAPGSVPTLVHHLIERSAARVPERVALVDGAQEVNYQTLQAEVERLARAYCAAGIAKGGRIGIFTEKRIEFVVAMFAASACGGAYVPCNPVLKADQVGHILSDCTASILVTTADRVSPLIPVLANIPSIKTLIVIGGGDVSVPGVNVLAFNTCGAKQANSEHNLQNFHRVIDQDVAAILYTSGSTGRPKGVTLSHRNIVAGAVSVSQYLELTQDERILSVLPLSFDAGMNQITTAFLVGARAVLINHLFARDVVNAVAKYEITGLAGVPPLWIQLAGLQWPESIQKHLRYITNTGGHMPRPTLDALRKQLPTTLPFLMYGLTEAFRSTYLPPSEIDTRPESMGKAIPNAEILVVREDGTLCDADEPGELVHRGVLVALGYWNDVEKTNERYKPVPGHNPALPITELAVWSGDTVKRDKDGYLYFVGRRDEMIKTSGYRTSPVEVEEIVYAMKGVAEVAAMGVKDERLGQSIAIVVYPEAESGLTAPQVLKHCKEKMPAYMVPQRIDIAEKPLPRNPNGKIDRKALAGALV